MNEQEYEIKNLKIKIIPKKFIPVNLDYEVTDYVTIEIYQNRVLRPSKLLKRQKYTVSPAMTIRAFLQFLSHDISKVTLSQGGARVCIGLV